MESTPSTVISRESKAATSSRPGTASKGRNGSAGGSVTGRRASGTTSNMSPHHAPIPVITPPEEYKGLDGEELTSGLEENKLDTSTMRASTATAVLLAEASELERKYELEKASGLRRKTILLDLNDPEAGNLSRLVNGDEFTDTDAQQPSAGVRQGSGKQSRGGRKGSAGSGPGTAGPSLFRKSSMSVNDPRESVLQALGGDRAGGLSRHGSYLDANSGKGMRRQVSVTFADAAEARKGMVSGGSGGSGGGLGAGLNPGLGELPKSGSSLMVSGHGGAGALSRQGSSTGVSNGIFGGSGGSGGAVAGSRRGSIGLMRTSSVQPSGFLGLGYGGGLGALHEKPSSMGKLMGSGMNMAQGSSRKESVVVAVNAKVPAGPNPAVLAKARARVRDRNVDVLAMVGTYDPWPLFWPSVRDEKEKRNHKGRPMKDEWERREKDRFKKIPKSKLGPGCYNPLPRIIGPEDPVCTSFKSQVPRFRVLEQGVQAFPGIGPGTYEREPQKTLDETIPWIKMIGNRIGRIMEPVPHTMIGTDVGLIEKIGDVKAPLFVGARKMNANKEKKESKEKKDKLDVKKGDGPPVNVKVEAHHPLDLHYFMKGPLPIGII